MEPSIGFAAWCSIRSYRRLILVIDDRVLGRVDERAEQALR